MLFGLANDLVVPAILMVVAISAGMALAIAAIGVAAILGRNWAEARVAFDPDRRVWFEARAHCGRRLRARHRRGAFANHQFMSIS
jgi:ABC-type nickel/cobalt efflux system permease component RcnA